MSRDWGVVIFRPLYHSLSSTATQASKRLPGSFGSEFAQCGIRAWGLGGWVWGGLGFKV